MGGGIIRGTKNFYEVKDMKAKRILSVLFAAAMSATLCAGLAGCGEEKDSGQKQPDTPVLPEKLVSEKVTETEWEAAFNEASFTDMRAVVTRELQSVSMSVNAEYEYIGADGKQSYKGTGKSVQTFDGKSETEEGTDEEYCELRNEGGHCKYYLYSKNEEGEWEAILSSQDLIGNGPVSSLFGYAEMYREFTYDGEAGAYICTEDNNEGGSIRHVLKFKDKKVVFAEMKTESEVNKYSDCFCYSIAYGAYSVTLPKIEKTLYGTYMFYEMKLEMKEEGEFATVIHVGESLGPIKFNQDFVTVTLKEDGKAVVSRDGVKSTGTFTQTGNTVEITGDGISQTFGWDGFLALMFTEEESGALFVLVK